MVTHNYKDDNNNQKWQSSVNLAACQHVLSPRIYSLIFLFVNVFIFPSFYLCFRLTDHLPPHSTLSSTRSRLEKKTLYIIFTIYIYNKYDKSLWKLSFRGTLHWHWISLCKNDLLHKKSQYYCMFTEQNDISKFLNGICTRHFLTLEKDGNRNERSRDRSIYQDSHSITRAFLYLICLVYIRSEVYLSGWQQAQLSNNDCFLSWSYSVRAWSSFIFRFPKTAATFCDSWEEHALMNHKIMLEKQTSCPLKHGKKCCFFSAFCWIQKLNTRQLVKKLTQMEKISYFKADGWPFQCMWIFAHFICSGGELYVCRVLWCLPSKLVWSIYVINRGLTIISTQVDK